MFLYHFHSLDYPGVGPEHSFLKDIGRAEYYSITDEEAIEGKERNLMFHLFRAFIFVYAAAQSSGIPCST